MTDALAPCPFCGGEAEWLDLDSDEAGGSNAGGSVISCKACQASSHVEFGRKENLVAAWNRRAPTNTEGGEGLVSQSQPSVATGHSDAVRSGWSRRDPELEARARAIYETWSDDPEFRPWVIGGNSFKQDEARRIAYLNPPASQQSDGGRG